MSRFRSFALAIRGQRMEFSSPLVMGILNVTPDSFYANSRKQADKDIAERANEIISQGGTIIDIGACSTRPGSEQASVEEEKQRLRYGLQIVRREQPDAIISVDTYRPEVARMAVEEFGADIINDVSGGCEEMFQAVSHMHVPYILTSAKPTIEEMAETFRKAITQLNAEGCKDIILDPGYGFGKDIPQNYNILSRQGELLSFGLPLLVGVSRKRMIWQLLGTSVEESLNGTTAVNVIALLHGANILRVHDVREAVEAVKITDKIDN